MSETFAGSPAENIVSTPNFSEQMKIQKFESGDQPILKSNQDKLKQNWKIQLIINILEVHLPVNHKNLNY